MNLPDYNYYKQIFKGHPLPLAYVDLDLFDENIKSLKARAGSKHIRIASKSVRCTTLLQRILSADDQFQGIMAYHPDEAIYLSQLGYDNILLGYPYTHSNHISVILEERQKGKDIVFMVDSKTHLVKINQVALEMNVKARVCLDIDMSVDFPGIHFGVYRSNLNSPDKAGNLLRIVSEFPQIEIAGIMGYEAQVAGLGNKVPGNGAMNTIISFLQRQSIPIIAKRREAVVDLLPEIEKPLINAGGTGSLESSSAEDWVTEVTAGSGFYSPGLFDNYAHFHHLPAMGFALEITRIPKKGIFTCAGGGYIASGAIGEDKAPKPYLPTGMKLMKNESAGEVQTPIIYKGSEKLSIGDPVFFRHSKAGELCERFNQLYLVSNGQIVDEVPTYRGEGHCFL